MFCEAVSLARLVKAEIVSPLFTGFSSIRTWVTQSCPLACLFDERRVPNGYGEGSWYSTSYKETKSLLLFSNLKTISPVATPPPSKAGSKRSWGRLLVFFIFIMRPRPVLFIQSSIESAPLPEFQHPGLQIQVLSIFDNVRFRPSRLMDALLRHGGGRAEVERGQVLDRQNLA